MKGFGKIAILSETRCVGYAKAGIKEVINGPAQCSGRDKIAARTWSQKQFLVSGQSEWSTSSKMSSMSAVCCREYV